MKFLLKIFHQLKLVFFCLIIFHPSEKLAQAFNEHSTSNTFPFSIGDQFFYSSVYTEEDYALPGPFVQKYYNKIKKEVYDTLSNGGSRLQVTVTSVNNVQSFTEDWYIEQGKYYTKTQTVSSPYFWNYIVYKDTLEQNDICGGSFQSWCIKFYTVFDNLFEGMEHSDSYIDHIGGGYFRKTKYVPNLGVFYSINENRSDYQYINVDSTSLVGAIINNEMVGDTNIIVDLITTVSYHNNIPTNYQLNQNFPNPFNPTTTISFSVPKLSYVTLKIFDCMGREVEILVSENFSPGSYSITWDASNRTSGVYFCKLQSNLFRKAIKLILLK